MNVATPQVPSLNLVGDWNQTADEPEDEWDHWESDPWAGGRDPWNKLTQGRQGLSRRKTGKELLDELFKCREKCPQCERAGVYDEHGELVKSFFLSSIPLGF